MSEEEDEMVLVETEVTSQMTEDGFMVALTDPKTQVMVAVMLSHPPVDEDDAEGRHAVSEAYQQILLGMHRSVGEAIVRWQRYEDTGDSGPEIVFLDDEPT